MRRSLPHLGPEAREEVEKLLEPRTLAIVAAVLVAWLISHAVGIGQIIDIILIALGVFSIGLVVFEGLDELAMFGRTALKATSEKELNKAGKHFANAVAILGIEAVLAVLFKGTPKSFKGERIDAGPPPNGGKISKQIKRDASLQKGEGFTDIWGQITISPRGTPSDRRLVAMHEKVHQILTPKLNVLRQFRVEGRAASYDKSTLSKYLEEAIAEAVAQLGVNGFKAAFRGVTFPVKHGYVTVFRKRDGLEPVIPEFVGLVSGGFLISGMQFCIVLHSDSSKIGPNGSSPSNSGQSKVPKHNIPGRPEHAR